MTMKGKKRFWAKVLAFMLIASMMVSNMATSSYAATVDETPTPTETSTDGTVKPVVEEPKKDEQKTDGQKQEITEKDESEEDAEKLKTSTDETKKDDMTSTEKTEEEKKTETPENANVGETSEEDSKVEDENTLKEEAVPEDVQAFLDAVAALPSIDQITVANATEIGEQVNAVLDMYEGLIDLGLDEREDVTAVMDTVYAVYEAVLAAEEIDDSENYYSWIQGKILNLGGVTKQVGDTGFYQRLPRLTNVCKRCGSVVTEDIPGDQYDAESITDDEFLAVTDNDLRIGSYKGGAATDDDFYIGMPCFEFNYRAVKPTPRTPVDIDLYYCFESAGESGWCVCGNYISFPANYNIYKDDISFYVEVNADYQLIYDANGGQGAPNSTKKTVSEAVCDFTVPSSKPTRDGYRFLGWAESAEATEAQYISGNTVKLNWSEGYGSESNPVTKTLYAVWAPGINSFEKSLVNSATEIPAGVNVTGIAYPVNGTVNVPGDGSVTLLYKITVTGTADAKYKVEDDGATWVGGANMEGTLPGSAGTSSSVDIYVTKSFTKSDIKDGHLENTANVTPGKGNNSSDSSTESTPATSTQKEDTTYTISREYYINGEKIAEVTTANGIKGKVGDKIVGETLAENNPKWKERKVDGVKHTFDYISSIPADPDGLTLGEDENNNTITLRYEENTQQLKLNSIVKERLTSMPKGVSLTVSEENINFDVPVKLGTDESATLLYKITVTGDKDASYIVKDAVGNKTATYVGGDPMTGVLSDGGKAEIYVTMAFSQNDINNGLTNKATLESGDKDTTKDPAPDSGTGETNTDANKTYTVTVNFKDDDSETLKDSINTSYDENDSYEYGRSEEEVIDSKENISVAALFLARANGVQIPNKIVKGGKTYVLDELRSADALSKLSGTVTSDVTLDLYYSLDEQGGKDPDGNDIPDGKADKYQVKVIYSADGKGLIDNQSTQEVYLELKSVTSWENPTGIVEIPNKAVVANSGYYHTGWKANAIGHEGWTLENKSLDTLENRTISAKGKAEYTFTAQYITAPGREDVPGILDPDGTDANFEFVTIDCVNTTINPLHDDITYSLVGNDDVIVGDISKDGNEYLCKVTVKAAPYVMKYNESRNEKHTLVDSTKASAELTLKWNADKNAWEPKDENTVTFEVRCGAPAANIDMTRNYSYILDANEAKEGTVNATLPVVIKDGKAFVNVADYKDYDGIDGIGTKTYEFKSVIVTKADGATVSVEDKDGILTFDAVQDTTYKVTLNYELKEKSKRTVIVRYVDEAGKVLGEVSENKEYGDSYNVNEKITETYTDKEGNNYMIIGVDPAGDPADGTVTRNIVVKVNCTLDNIGPDGRPDNVPDKYQATVTFQAVNGTVTGAGTDGTYKTVLTLTNPDIKDEKNPDGWATAAAGGKAALLAVPTTNPNAGYGNGTWNAVPRVGMEITEDRTFVITYTATTPTNPPTTPTTPPTGGGGTGGGGTPDPTPTPTPTAVLPIAPTVIPAAAPTPAAPAETPEAEPVEEIEDAEIPLANDETPAQPEAVKIEEEEVPLASGKSWALLNLILAILTVVVSVVLLVGYFFGKKKDQEEDDEIQTYQDEEQQKELKRKGSARILSILPAVVSVIFFILTENMRNPMIFVDKWTLWMAVFAIANVALAILSKKTRKDDDDNKQKPGYEMA